MNSGKRIDLSWGILSQFLQYGSSLLVLPLMVTRLSSAQVGLWYLFMAIQSLVVILDFGFTPTFSRNFTFVFAGVDDLQKEGVSRGDGSVNPELLASLVRSSRMLYAGIGTLVGLAMLGPGSWYLHSLLVKTPGVPQAWLAWGLFIIAVSTNLYFLWYTPLLLGAGRIRDDYKVGIINRGGFALLAGVGLLFSNSLVVVSAAYLGGVILSRIYAGRVARILIPSARTGSSSYRDVFRLIKILWHNSYRMGIVSIGAFLITRFSVFVVSSFYGLAATAQFSISLQIFSVIASISQVALITFLPRLAKCRVSGDMIEFKQLFMFATLFIWTISITLDAGVILFGNHLLVMLHSRTLLMNREVLLMMAAIWLLETNHSACAGAIATGNRIPFLNAAVFSGLGICILSLMAGWMGLGVWAIILAQGIVQLAYNNWKWPSVLYGELKITRNDLGRLFLDGWDRYGLRFGRGRG